MKHDSLLEQFEVEKTNFTGALKFMILGLKMFHVWKLDNMCYPVAAVD